MYEDKEPDLEHSRENRIKEHGLCGICKKQSYFFSSGSCPKTKTVVYKDGKVSKCDKSELLPVGKIRTVDSCFLCENYECGICMYFRVPVRSNICNSYKRKNPETNAHDNRKT